MVRVSVRIKFTVCLVSGYAHVSLLSLSIFHGTFEDRNRFCSAHHQLQLTRVFICRSGMNSNGIEDIVLNGASSVSTERHNYHSLSRRRKSPNKPEQRRSQTTGSPSKRHDDNIDTHDQQTDYSLPY